MSQKKINNNTKQTVFWSFHRVVVEEAGLLGCCAVCMGNFFPTFEETPLSPSGLWVGPQASKICCYSSSPVVGFGRQTSTERCSSLQIVAVPRQHDLWKFRTTIAILSGKIPQQSRVLCWKLTLNASVWALTFLKNCNIKTVRFRRNSYLTSCNYIRGVHIFQNSRNNFKILSARSVISRRMSMENPKILGTTIKKNSYKGILAPWICSPLTSLFQMSL